MHYTFEVSFYYIPVKESVFKDHKLFTTAQILLKKTGW